MNTGALKFLDSYEKGDRSIYFGREKQIKELYEKVTRSKLVVLYGLSGTGKTSLIQCGLANEFSDSDWLEITIRRGGYPSIIDAIIDKFKSLNPGTDYIGPVLVETLRQIYLQRFKPIYLIFDQFEEVFINGSEKEIKRILSFFYDIIQDTGLRCTIILSLREEYFSHLDKFEKKIPMIFDSKLRLERMSRVVVEDVVYNICRKSGIKPEEGCVEEIINKIENQQTHSVELPYLQIFLNELFKESGQLLTKERISKAKLLDNILSDYLEEEVKRISEIADLKLIWEVLKRLITDDGTKNAVVEDKFFKDFGANKDKAIEIVGKLIEARIIHRQDQFLELKHDSLATKISQNRTADEKLLYDAYRIFLGVKTYDLTEEQIVLIQPHLGSFKKLIKNDAEYNNLMFHLQRCRVKISRVKRKTKRMRLLIQSLASLFVAGILSVLWFQVNSKYQRAIRDADDAYKSHNYSKAHNLYATALLHPWFLFIDENKFQAKQDSAARMLLRDSMAQVALQQGENLFGRAMLDSAYIYIDSACRLNPADTIYVLRRGVVLMEIQRKMEELTVAIETFEKANGETGKYYSRLYSRDLEKLKRITGK